MEEELPLAAAGYLLALAPPMLLLFGLPTLEEAAKGQLLLERPLCLQLSDMNRHYKNLVLSELALEEGRWWTLLSHAFVHQDLQHLFSNVQGMLTSGFTVFQDLGAFGLYGVFFTSAAASALNSWGRARQTRAQLEGSIPPLPEQLGPLWVPEGARELWDSLRASTARRAAPMLHARSEAYGASGAVCGLTGYGLGVSLLRLGSVAVEWAATSSAAERMREAPRRNRDVLGALVSCCSAVQSGYFLAQEWRLASGKDGMTGIDHAGHLTGFATGFALALLATGGRWLHGPLMCLLRGEGRASHLTRRYVNAHGELVHR